MLGKLMKYEWKSIYKVSAAILIVMLAMTILGSIMLRFPAVCALLEGKSTIPKDQQIFYLMACVLGLLLYMFLLIGAAYGIVIYLGVRFYNTMYGSQGYLTHTLPVTGNQIFLSKVLVSGGAYLVVEVAIFVSLAVLFFSMLAGIGQVEGYTVEEMLREMYGAFFEAMEEVGINRKGYLVFLIIVTLVTPFTSMIILFGSITLGQLSKKRKALMGVVIYFGVLILNMVITAVIQTVQTLKASLEVMNGTPDAAVLNMGISYKISLALALLGAAAMYASSYYILNRKKNLD